MSKEANGVTFEGKEDFDTKKPHNEAQEHTMKGLCKKGQQEDKRSICGGRSRSVGIRGPSRGRASGRRGQEHVVEYVARGSN